MSEQDEEMIGKPLHWKWHGAHGRGVVKQVRNGMKGGKVYLCEGALGMWHLVLEEDVVNESAKVQDRG